MAVKKTLLKKYFFKRQIKKIKAADKKLYFSINMAKIFDCAGGASRRGAQPLTRRAGAAEIPQRRGASAAGILGFRYMPTLVTDGRERCGNGQ